MNKVGIIGCGKILPRHIEAINQNENYKLMALCDLDSDRLSYVKNKYFTNGYQDYKEMIKNEDINFVVICSPNSLHFEQAIYSLKSKCDVLVEKPAVLNPSQILAINETAFKFNQNAYTVLQVRLNDCIQNLKHLIESGKIGTIRGFSLVQRWQRPQEYFNDWRGDPLVGGGILYECGIHYLDILCYFFGKPNVKFVSKYNRKHFDVQIEDTLYCIAEYKNFAGTIEVNISTEPRNMECSLTLLTSDGLIKIGGKAMNAVEVVAFSDELQSTKVANFLNSKNEANEPNSYGNYSGSCPNHPDLYRNIEKFPILETNEVLSLIDEIYSFCNIKYY